MAKALALSSTDPRGRVMWQSMDSLAPQTIVGQLSQGSALQDIGFATKTRAQIEKDGDWSVSDSLSAIMPGLAERIGVTLVTRDISNFPSGDIEITRENQETYNGLWNMYFVANSPNVEKDTATLKEDADEWIKGILNDSHASIEANGKVFVVPEKNYNVGTNTSLSQNRGAVSAAFQNVNTDLGFNFEAMPNKAFEMDGKSFTPMHDELDIAAFMEWDREELSGRSVGQNDPGFVVLYGRARGTIPIAAIDRYYSFGYNPNVHKKSTYALDQDPALVVKLGKRIRADMDLDDSDESRALIQEELIRVLINGGWDGLTAPKPTPT